MLSSDGTAPVDRPNLSKDYLAGNAPEDGMVGRVQEYFRWMGYALGELGLRRWRTGDALRLRSLAQDWLGENPSITRSAPPQSSASGLITFQIGSGHPFK